MSENNIRKPRIEWIDMAKGIAIILVIVGHTIDYSSPLRSFIFSFHMPLFFILAGYTFRPKPWRMVVKSSAKRLLLPYLLLFLLWKVPNLLAYTDYVGKSALLGLAGSFIFAAGTTVQPFGFEATGMSWFLVALFCSRLIMNGICHVSAERKGAQAIEGALSLAALGVGVLFGKALHLYLPLSLDVSLVAVFFMWIGYMGKNLNTAQLLSAPAGIAAAIVWIICARFSFLELAARDYRMLPLALIAAAAGTLMVCAASRVLCDAPQVPALKQVRAYLLFSGRNSLAIYCFHAVDWWLPWSTMPALAALPFPHGASACFRVAYNTLYAKLAKSFA